MAQDEILRSIGTITALTGNRHYLSPSERLSFKYIISWIEEVARRLNVKP